ncbi:type VI secretion system protein TssA [Chromobacterium haemolyticum]|uniref:ImpA N-terminal domain-containing protein n=1 Tax=Chromobacterium haemolyticum TaxID=394935 RepID=A0A1W0CE41_9NEIS|nr:type VI secretion system protein TssA [Chromobacterium haemolyticum]OQS32963.1 hypothetical protein B0T45_21035 [Chromobacterium haemolyticum]
MLIDITEYLGPLSVDFPSGKNLEYTADFQKLETLLQGKAEVQYGETLIAAESPDWHEVSRLTLCLLKETRDLRVAMSWIRAMLHLHGYQGLALGLRLLADWLEQLWPTLHPQLDPDDGYDPTARLNVLNGLSEHETFLKPLRETTLFASKFHGNYSVRELDILQGEATCPEYLEIPTAAGLQAAQAEIDELAFDQLWQQLNNIHQDIQVLEALVSSYPGCEYGLNLDPLRLIVSKARRAIKRKPTIIAELQASTEDCGGTAPIQVSLTSIKNREDVIVMLNKICQYYAENEPSSPVPLLLIRAQKLVPMTFMEIVHEMASDAAQQVRLLVGGYDSQ